MHLALKHPFLLIFALILAGFLTLQFLRTKPDKTPELTRVMPTTFSILVSRPAGSDFVQLVVQKLNPDNGSPSSQEVFTLQRVGVTPTIVHYTSTSPDFLSPAAISQLRQDGKALPLEQQAVLQAWLRGQSDARLRQLDQTLQQKTKLGIFAAVQLAQDGKFPSSGTPQELLHWIVLPSKQTTANDAPATPRDLQLQIALDSGEFENPESFAQRLANEFQQRSSSEK